MSASPFMEFHPLSDEKRRELVTALRRNVEEDAAILLNPKDTSFEGVAQVLPDRDEDLFVINQIRAIPCHYGA